jgi:hypothetical protein
MVVLPAGPQRGEVEHGGPSLGVRGQARHCRRAGRQAVDGTEQLVRLGSREREVARAELGELAERAQACEPQARHRARQQDELDVARERGDGVVERSQTAGVRDRLQVVDDHHDAPLLLGERAGERIDRRLDDAGVCIQARERVGPRARAHAAEADGDRRPQPNGVVVASVRAHPDELVPALGQPCLHRDGLAVAGRGGEQRELSVAASVQQAPQTRSPDDPAAQRGRCEPPGRLHRHSPSWRNLKARTMSVMPFISAQMPANASRA